MTPDMTDTPDTNITPDAPKDGAPFYCPGCGRAWEYRTQCEGMTPAAPHPPIEVVSTDELHGDPADHTPAPNTDT